MKVLKVKKVGMKSFTFHLTAFLVILCTKCIKIIMKVHSFNVHDLVLKVFKFLKICFREALSQTFCSQEGLNVFGLWLHDNISAYFQASYSSVCLLAVSC